MKTKSLIVFLALSIILLQLTTTARAQGSLAPPPGVPTAGMKTLQQVEPRIDVATLAGDASHHYLITAPGSYFLSGNLNESTKYTCIGIQASNVTLDLMGFTLSRTAGTPGIGIQIPAGSQHCTVRNGMIRGFATGLGVETETSEALNGDSGVVEDITAMEYSYVGIDVGHSWHLQNCRALNGSNSSNEYMRGIGTGTSCVLVKCSATGNSSSSDCYGISCGSGCSLSQCVASGNASTAQSCTGIRAGDSSSLSDCSGSSNTGATYCVGINATVRCSLANCSAGENAAAAGVGTGMRASEGAVLTGCAAVHNQGKTAIGIDLHNGSSATHCTANWNEGSTDPDPSLRGVGISADTGCSVTACTVKDNKGDGIRVGGNCSVSDCQASASGSLGTAGAGVHALGAGNRIEANNVCNNITGIKVDDIRSLIIRNSAYSNGTAYSIAAGNKYGPIVTAPSNAAVNGSTSPAGNAAGSTDPWANFTF